MEQILARRATLSRELLVRADDGVAYGAFRLALECTGDISTPSREAIGYAAVLHNRVSTIDLGVEMS